MLAKFFQINGKYYCFDTLTIVDDFTIIDVSSGKPILRVSDLNTVFCAQKNSKIGTINMEPNEWVFNDSMTGVKHCSCDIKKCGNFFNFYIIIVKWWVEFNEVKETV